MKRVLVGVLAGVAVAAAGCGSGSKPLTGSTMPVTARAAIPNAAIPTAPNAAIPTAPNAAAASDEQQIRDLIKKEEVAFAAFDFARAAELTCTKYREIKKEAGTVVPPINDVASREMRSSVSASDLAMNLMVQYPKASDASLYRLADALTRDDVPAFKEAYLEILRQSTKFTVNQVANIKITGDTATADITTTKELGLDPPSTETKTNVAFVKENGQWKDCQPPLT